MPYVEIAVTCRTSRRSGTFSYSVPPSSELRIGDLVWVPFGQRQVQGVVFELSARAPEFPTKEVISLAEDKPVFVGYQTELARWLAEHYCCPLSSVVSQMLPAEIRRSAGPVYTLGAAPPAEPITPQATALLLALSAGAKSLSELRKVAPGGPGRQAVRALVEQGAVSEAWVLASPKARPKTERTVRLAILPEALPAALKALRRSPAQAAALRWLVDNAADGAPLPLAEACRRSGASAATFVSLANHGYLAEGQAYVGIGDREVKRSPLAGTPYPRLALPTLTEEQARVFSTLAAALRTGEQHAFLLHGVTGSGKGEVYLHALSEAIRLGRQAIVLVPEIALTPQTVRRFVARFAGRVAVLHSRLSAGEHYDEWRRARDGEVDVVIGSRSALFAPLAHLGLVVVDEEHEWAYKQVERDPRYHARDAALTLARAAGAVAVLGSATPDIESYYRACERAELHLLELRQRVEGGQAGSAQSAGPPTPPKIIPLPKVQIVDMRSQQRTSLGVFSLPLRRGIAEALKSGSQVILYLNRRGTATHLSCRACGYVARCRRCDLPLVYHADRSQILCHQCSRAYPVPAVCPECWSRSLEFQGVGTQRVEAEVKHLFPRARVVRWDSDSTRTKGAHQRILERFLSGEADILVGTQMVAKGLDLPRVALVGVVAADTTLHLPDFRAAERTFQLLSQVSGRAGRGPRPGKVIVQTLNPEHYCLRAARGHDYTSLYREEIAFRTSHRYPPFAELVKLVFRAGNEARCRRESERLATFLRSEVERLGLPDADVIGPAPAFRRRLRGRFRWQIVVRGTGLRSLLAGLPLPMGWALDVDPISLL